MALSSDEDRVGDFRLPGRFQTLWNNYARNGATYEGPATDIPFSANVKYHFGSGQCPGRPYRFT